MKRACMLFGRYNLSDETGLPLEGSQAALNFLSSLAVAPSRMIVWHNGVQVDILIHTQPDMTHPTPKNLLKKIV